MSTPAEPKTGREGRTSGRVDNPDLLQTKIAEVLNRWPSAGLAVGVVRDGGLAWFHGQSLADIPSKKPITEGTVFRIGSITKTFTAIAIMQLWEHGLVDLDVPANDYLRTVRLIPTKPNLRPASVRHLLTHTAGIGYWRRLSDLLRPGVGSGVRAGRSATSLTDYYRRGPPVEVEPGTKWVYSNHGFAALGQIVEDISGQPLDRYMREHVFFPLGMEHTDLVRSDRVRDRPSETRHRGSSPCWPARRHSPSAAACGVAPPSRAAVPDEAHEHAVEGVVAVQGLLASEALHVVASLVWPRGQLANLVEQQPRQPDQAGGKRCPTPPPSAHSHDAEGPSVVFR